MNRRSATSRTFSGWPVLAVLAILIAGVLYQTLARQEPAVRVKPATGSAQAMALAAARDDAASKQAGDVSKQ
jgi:putative copper export protein